MSNPYEAWVVEQRPIYSRLPDCYKDKGDGESLNNSVVSETPADWLTYYFDNLLIQTKNKVDDLERNLDPLTCDEIWLDYLAPLCGWQGIWDVSWPTEAKRSLLAQSYTLIWPNKGSLEVLSFILDTLGVKHFVQLGQSFLVDISLVGDRIGSIAWDYDILLPTIYYGQPQFKVAKNINKLFGPCWCRSSVIFDDSKFGTFNVYGLEDGSLLSTESFEAIEL